MGRVLGIVYRCIATHLIKKAGFSRKTAQTGAVTLIQRFGSALNLNVHFHMLFLDGVYIERPDGSLFFRWVKAPSGAELTRSSQTLARRKGHYLERQGLVERDAENSYLAGAELKAGPMERLLGSSIRYRIAVVGRIDLRRLRLYCSNAVAFGNQPRTKYSQSRQSSQDWASV